MVAGKPRLYVEVRIHNEISTHARTPVLIKAKVKEQIYALAEKIISMIVETAVAHAITSGLKTVTDAQADLFLSLFPNLPQLEESFIFRKVISDRIHEHGLSCSASALQSLCKMCDGLLAQSVREWAQKQEPGIFVGMNAPNIQTPQEDPEEFVPYIDEILRSLEPDRDKKRKVTEEAKIKANEFANRFVVTAATIAFKSSEVRNKIVVKQGDVEVAATMLSLGSAIESARTAVRMYSERSEASSSRSTASPRARSPRHTQAGLIISVSRIRRILDRMKSEDAKIAENAEIALTALLEEYVRRKLLKALSKMESEKRKGISEEDLE